MKKIIILVSLLISTLSFAQVHQAKSFNDLIDRIENAEFTYKETGKIFGFVSTHSCLHVSEDIVIFKNYCWPVRTYPARGYTIITREHGIIDLYEETFPDVLLRVIRIDQFPVYVSRYLEESLPTYTLGDLSGMMEELYPRYLPGCWSTNFSRYTETHEAKCTLDLSTVINGTLWAQETQALVNDEATWLNIMARVEAKLKR